VGHEIGHDLLKVFDAHLFKEAALGQFLFHKSTAFQQERQIFLLKADIDNQPVLNRMIFENLFGIGDDRIIPGQVPGNVRVDFHAEKGDCQKSRHHGQYTDQIREMDFDGFHYGCLYSKFKVIKLFFRTSLLAFFTINK